MLAQRTSLLSGSGTADARAAAKAAAESGKEIVDLSAGEIWIEPPPGVRDGAIKAIERGVNRYTESIGMDELRQAIARKVSLDTGAIWDASEIAVTSGAKQALLDAALILLNPGDEVIIPRPCWPTFPAQVTLAGARPAFVDTAAPTYQPGVDDIRAAVTSATKAIIINSPNNPTGAVYGRELMADIVELAVRYDLWLISDECYDSFVFDPNGRTSIVNVHNRARSRTLLVNAFSKQLAMTGWRLGYLAAPREIISTAKKLQSHTTSNPNVIAQHAVLHHLETTDGTWERNLRSRLGLARSRGLEILARLKDVPPPIAQGGFFFYLDLSRVRARIAARGDAMTIDQISRELLRKTGVGSVAGSSFGDPSGLRLSFGAPLEQLEPALRRVVSMLNSLG
jgi:aspartate aminotransferase